MPVQQTSTGAACYCPDLNAGKLMSFDFGASVFTAESTAINGARDITIKNPHFVIINDALSRLTKTK